MVEDLITLLWIVVKILIIILPLFLIVAYVTFAERKVIGYMQARLGPNRVGFHGIGQPIADIIKLLCKEIIIPSQSNRYLFIVAPLLTLVPSLCAWSVIPFDAHLVFANINAGILFLFSMTSLATYGILVSGWASNSKYAFFGSLRSAAQIISYEISMGFAIVGVLMASGSLNLQILVQHQAGGIWHWYWLPLLPLWVIYWISALAETNRAPFDMAEGESEIVAGFHVEYAGMGFALFFLAEYANMILISCLVSLMFFGGWLSPFEGIPGLETVFAWVPGFGWLILKTATFLFLYLWIRATFPRYRYDQLMYLGWKVLIPVALVWIVVIGFAIQFKVAPWFNT